jgi:hypothetical protein
MKVICRDRRTRLAPAGPSGRAVTSVSDDIDQLLGPKTLDQLTSLEAQVKKKLQSNEPIDVEYWEQLLSNIGVNKAKAELKNVYKSVIESRLKVLKEQQIEEAEMVQAKLALLLARSEGVAAVQYSRAIDPEPQLKIRAEDKSVEVIEESDFLSKIVGFNAIFLGRY